ncbi:hypothetical protein [Apilactobacillus timberlakei]|uniref:hypothetical protein n=2 Tax=Apilactobacillus timberlakei TaxID=2008380 RepID=UPI001CDCE812|nr:hypothetical protein [Apilactobacillus timberlakei]
MKLWFSMDEYYTLDIIRYDLKTMINKDLLDVHPPLYYILLKIFLYITLPFKHSLVIEIIMGRIFSIIISMISLVYLFKINKYFKICLSKSTQLFIFLILPNVIGIENLNLEPMMNLRMYSLAALFVVATWYYILKFNFENNFRSIFLVIVFAELSAYTHYYAAMMSGLFILFYFILFYFKKNKTMYSIYFFSGLLYLILYLPWIFYGLRVQFKDLSYGQPLYKSLIEGLFAIALLIFFGFPLKRIVRYSNSHYSNDLNILFYVNCFSLFPSLIYSIFKSPIYLLRYSYPSLLLVEFISVSYLFYKFNYLRTIHNNYKRRKLYILFVIYFISFLSFFSLFHEAVKVFPISIKIYNNDNKLREINSKYVNVGKINRGNIDPYDINGSMGSYNIQYSLYLRSINKIPFLNDKKQVTVDNSIYPNSKTNPHTELYFKK